MLVCLGSYRDTKDWVAYKQQNVYLTVLDAGQSEINVSGKEMLPDFIQGHLLSVSSHGRRGQGSCLRSPL